MGCSSSRNSKPRVAWVEGNDTLMRIYLYEGNPKAEFTVDVYDNFTVEAIRNNAFRAKGLTYGLDENNRIVVRFPNTLPKGDYTIRTWMTSNGMERRSVLCGVVSVVSCDADVRIPTGIVGGNECAYLDVKFEIVSSVWEQGKNAYEFWKMIPGNEDKTLQDYLDYLQ